MPDRALLVAIEAYDSVYAPNLEGCKNDVSKITETLQSANVAASSIIYLSDKDATADNIRNGLRSLVANAKGGDRLIFHYSGHGAQVPVSDTEAHDCIVPVDFYFQNGKYARNIITDTDFSQLFGAIPAGAQVTWISDSCSSGGLARKVFRPNQRSFSLPLGAQNILQNIQVSLLQRSLKTLLLTDTANALSNVTMYAACKSTEEANPLLVGDKLFGAFSYALTSVLGIPLSSAPARTIVSQTVAKVISLNVVGQTPELHGDPSLYADPFLHKV